MPIAYQRAEIMDRATKAGLIAGAVATLWVAAVIVIEWNDTDTKRRQFESNERAIAEANARREASLTPEQKEARRLAALDAAAASARKADLKRRAEFIKSARGGCLIALKRSLHDPGSAEFGQTSEWQTSTDDSGRVTVLARVRARNGFGAMRLSTFRCVVEPAGLDSLRVVALDQIKP